MGILLRLLPFLALVSLVYSGFPSAALAQQRPNIVLIYADDIGYSDFGSYGATSVKTPNVDRLAKQGIRFTNGYASSGTCTPSRYSMLTGGGWRLYHSECVHCRQYSAVTGGVFIARQKPLCVRLRGHGQRT